MSDERFDVVAVNICTNVVRVIAVDKDRRDADAIVQMAVMRRGVEEEFFAAVECGCLRDGDQYR